MKKHLSHLLAFIAFFCISHQVTAQTDSLLDLGRIKIRKDFVQSITIKGSDLQKIPFGTISEVISPWLHGAMNSRANLVFVVDGNMVNDVNAWSIYDIEEITLVQNALVQVNGAINQQQLVLVKTKRNTGSSGITFAGSSALAKNYGDDVMYSKSETNFYHQYHLGARKDFGKISAGASANWVRDVYPLKESWDLKTKTPRQLSRFRFNGWFDIALAEGHSISAGVNYVPQKVDYDYSYVGTNALSRYYAKLKQSLINPYIKFSNRIGGGFSNELSVSYLTGNMPVESFYGTNYIVPSQQSYYSQSTSKHKLTNLLIREQVSYNKSFGDWLLAPAVNFTYRSIVEKFGYSNTTGTVINPPSINTGNLKVEAESYVLTPSVGISYKNSFHLAGGVAASLTDDTKPMGDGVFPFASVTVDVLRLGNAGSPESLKIFGSYAKAPNFADMYFSQQSVSVESAPVYGPSLQPVFGPGIVMPNPFPDNANRNSLQAGATYTTAGDEFQVSYNFNDRRYVDMLMYQMPGPSGYVLVIIWPDYHFTSHRLGAMARIGEARGWQWHTGLNVTTFKTKMKYGAPFTGGGPVSNNDKANWTGGWTNRIQFKKFSFGVDLQYIINEQRPIGAFTFEKFDSWRLNTLYAAYSLNMAKNHPLELYLTTRNMMQEDHGSFAGNRTQYYGAGFKLQF